MDSTWWTARSIRLHCTLLIVLPAFGVFFWWQLRRALSGNELSWAYTIEWPIFGAYAVFMWWRLVHEPPLADAGLRPKAWGRARSARDTERLADEAAELARYNAYLAALAKADEENDRDRKEKQR